MYPECLTHNFVISGEESVKRFFKALDEAAKEKAERGPEPELPFRELKDPDEIKEFMKGVFKNYGIEYDE